MDLTIYGSPRSRTMRVLWAAAELRLPYEHIPLAWDDPALKSPAFLKLNPAGTIPVIVDDGFALSESLAINLYLAKKYGSGGSEPLYPGELPREAECWRWSLWAQGHLEPWIQGDLRTTPLHQAAGALMHSMAQPSLAHLEQVLSDRPWIIAEHFTVADLNVCAVLSPSRTAKLDLASLPHLRGWLARCYGRPASLETRRRFQG
jgi:glutathione S-transferase